MVSTPLSIVWPCRPSVSEYVAADKKIEVPEVNCPKCGERLGRWSGYRRPVRPDGDHRIWVRRGRCGRCRTTHALLPDFVHERRYDAVEVIGAGLETNLGGVGMRKVAEKIGVPNTTARGWRRRHRARAPTLLAHFAEMVSRLGAAVGEVPKDTEIAVLSLARHAWTAAKAKAMPFLAVLERDVRRPRPGDQHQLALGADGKARLDAGMNQDPAEQTALFRYRVIAEAAKHRLSADERG